jgi:hypothetical protein
MRVSLTPALKRDAVPGDNGLPLLDGTGPLVCMGGATGADGLAVPVQPSATTLFGPRGACLLAEDGPLWVCDTGHHRLLGWRVRPPQDDTPADWVIGQPDFSHEGRNAKREPSAITLNVPTGIAPCGEGLVVADAWNHRVLIWRTRPEADNVPADIVLGQADFSGAESNRGGADATASTLFWPYGVFWDGDRLWVADTGNRRVLMWQGLPERNGQPADLVLGHDSFLLRDENGGGSPTASSMRWPHAIVLWQGRLCVADAGNNRIMVWQALPTQNNVPCDIMLGQRDFNLVDHNQSLYWPSPATLNMPYGLAAVGPWLLTADTANSRLLGWHESTLQTGAAATRLTGQEHFQAKGDNAWQPATRDSLCWPYGILAAGKIAVVADSGNNRVLLWPLADALTS